jgi:hypothetical protein
VPDFLTRIGIDQQVTQLALTLYGILAATGGLGVLKKSELPQDQAATT